MNNILTKQKNKNKNCFPYNSSIMIPSQLSQQIIICLQKRIFTKENESRKLYIIFCCLNKILFLKTTNIYHLKNVLE